MPLVISRSLMDVGDAVARSHLSPLLYHLLGAPRRCQRLVRDRRQISVEDRIKFFDPLKKQLRQFNAGNLLGVN